MSSSISTSFSFIAFTSIIVFFFLEHVKSDCTNGDENDKFNKNTMPGGPVNADPNSSKIKQIAERLRSEMNSQSDANCKVNVEKILCATSQVVSGVQYVLEMKLCPYDCISKSAKTNSCKICSATVWEKSWENFFNVTRFVCD